MSSYYKAAQVYQKKNDQNLTPMQIVVELYKGMIKNVRDAKKCWAAGQLDVMTDHITKVFNILEALQAHLDVEQGGEDARFLQRFYTVIFSALCNATAKPEPGEEFDNIAAYIQQVCDRWTALAYPRQSENTASVEQAVKETASV